MKNLIILIALLFSIGLLSNCRNCATECHTVTVPKVDTAIVSYFPFKPGSWWVYVDNIGETDSLYITKYTHNFASPFTVCEKPCDINLEPQPYKVDSFSITLTSSKNSSYTIMALGINNPVSNFGILCFNNPFGVGIKDSSGRLYAGDSTETYVPIPFATIIMDTFKSVNNIVYKDVIEVFEKARYYSWDYHSESQPVYFAKGIGIVQKTYNSKVYFLTKYNLVK